MDWGGWLNRVNVSVDECMCICIWMDVCIDVLMDGWMGGSWCMYDGMSRWIVVCKAQLRP